MTVRDFLEQLALRGDQSVTLIAGGAWRVIEPIKLRRNTVQILLNNNEAEDLLSSEVGMIDFNRENISAVYRAKEKP